MRRLGYASVRRDSWDKHIGFVRRQENTRTTFEMPKKLVKDFGVEHYNHSVINNPVTGGFYADNKSDISNDFSRNAMDDFTRTFNLSNELIARRFMKSQKHNRQFSARYKANAEKDYLESLEHYNKCRNCSSPIKVRKCTILGAEVTVGVIEAHTEVYFDFEKNAYKYRKVEKREILNKVCECMFVEVRRAERKARVRASNRIM